MFEKGECDDAASEEIRTGKKTTKITKKKKKGKKEKVRR